jgi:hypothetical protein
MRLPSRFSEAATLVRRICAPPRDRRRNDCRRLRSDAEKISRLRGCGRSRRLSRLGRILPSPPDGCRSNRLTLGLHAEHGIAAARHGLHVLVEKPIDITTGRADDLITACENAGVKLRVLQDRTSSGIRRLKRDRRGRIGGSPFWRQPRSGGTEPRSIMANRAGEGPAPTAAAR